MSRPDVYNMNHASSWRNYADELEQQLKECQYDKKKGMEGSLARIAELEAERDTADRERNDAITVASRFEAENAKLLEAAQTVVYNHVGPFNNSVRALKALLDAEDDVFNQYVEADDEDN